MGPALPPASPAAVALFQAMCLDSYPRFADAPARLRLAEPRARAAQVESAPLWGGLDGPHRVWTAPDPALPLPDRYMMGITRGQERGQSVASCYVVDKVGFSGAQARARLHPSGEAADAAWPGSMTGPRVVWMVAGRDRRPVLLQLTVVDTPPGEEQRYHALTVFASDSFQHLPALKAR